MPWDWSPCHTEAMSMSSSVGIDFSSAFLASWFMQIGWHNARGVMKLGDDGTGLSLASDIISLSASQVDPAPCSRRVESFTLVYNHAGWERF
jgi:hypothetical protein